MTNIRLFEQFRPNIDDTAWVDPSAVIIGQVHVGAHASLWPNVTVRGDINRIVIGQYTNVQDGSVLHVTHDNPDRHPGGYALTIGNSVTVGHNVVLHGCTIEDYCLIGIGAIVLDGAHIEKQVYLAAGSLVTPGTRLESGFLYMGSPVKKARPLTQDEIIGLQYSAENYVRLKNNYLKQA